MSISSYYKLNPIVQCEYELLARCDKYLRLEVISKCNEIVISLTVGAKRGEIHALRAYCLSMPVKTQGIHARVMIRPNICPFYSQERLILRYELIRIVRYYA